jgi:hypothetical protein
MLLIHIDAWNLRARQIHAAGVVILCAFGDLTIGDQNEYDNGQGDLMS